MRRPIAWLTQPDPLDDQLAAERADQHKSQCAADHERRTVDPRSEHESLLDAPVAATARRNQRPQNSTPENGGKANGSREWAAVQKVGGMGVAQERGGV